MTAAEIAIWSGCMGVYVACFAVAVINSVLTRSVAGAHAAAFILAAGAFIWVGSGLVQVFMPGLSAPAVRILALLMGPMAGAVACAGLIAFLRAHQRDVIVQYGLMLACGVSAMCLLSFLWPNYDQALEIVAWTIIGCAVTVFWLTLRAALLGDRFAWPMAAACIAMLVMVMVLYATILGVITSNLSLQAIGSVAATSYLLGVAMAVWRRNTEYLRMRRALAMHREKDLLTQLWTGAALIKRVEQTVARARRNRKETAIFCVEIFNIAQLRQELGNNATEQVIYSIAARVRHSVGSSTEVGRYDDSSFVVIVESVKQPSVLRTMGLRLATAVCRQYVLNPQSTSPRDFRADMGVGVARLPASRDAKAGRQSRMQVLDTRFSYDTMGVAQEAMHEASALAKAARKFASRAAIVDAYSRKTVALEAADLR
jgi:diguanylate cyclase (GGDEF)-like protein